MEHLRQFDENVGMSHLSQSGIEVEVTTLDHDVLQNLQMGWKRVSLIKIDVEGCEPEVLRGADDLIWKDEPVIVLEVNNSALARRGHKHEEITDFLYEHGYTYRFYQPGCTMETSEQSDIICIPQ